MKICCCQMYSGNKIMISSENATFAYIQSEQYVWHMKWYPRKLERQVEAVWYIFCVYGTIWEHLEWYVNYTKTVHNYNVVLELTCLCVLLFCFVGNTTIDLNSPSCESKKIWCRKVANRVHWIIMANWYGCYTTKQLAWTTHTLTHLPILMV